MALEVKIKVTLALNKTSIDIEDNGTNWGVGGNPGTGDINSIIAKVYKRTSSSPDYEVTFTGGEIASFVGGTAVNILFTDGRWFGETYAPDDFYTVQLYINNTYTSDSGYFSLILDLEKLVYKNTTTISIRPNGLIESQQIVGAVVGLDTLTRIDADTSVTRKYKWGIVYDMIYSLITKFY